MNNNNNISLGLLEFGDRGNENSLTAINQILEYAIEADKLSFSRFWLGEHHGPDPRVPFTNPEILLTLIAGMTEDIRIGTAGTLVKMYEPYSVATNFKLLNNLFSNRIDLGLAKANPGTKYLNKIIDFGKEGLFESKIKDIYELFHNELLNFDNDDIVVPPYKGEIPQTWYLSNSYNKFNDAIKYKLNFCRSLIHGRSAMDREFEKEKLLACKEAFYKANKYYPKITLAVGVSISNTIEDAKNKFEIACENEGITLSQAWAITPVTINYLHELLYSYQDSYGIDEFILFDIESNSKQKINNIQEISEKFNLRTKQ